MSPQKLSRIGLIDAVWQKTGMDKRDIAECYDTVVETIKAALERQMTVELRGFGTFSIRIRKPRLNALNPKTRELVPVRPHGVCSFKPGTELKMMAWKIDGGAAGIAAPDSAPPQ
ncbi:MAG: HU family DNA-binding protein [Spirochaetaceae bacterium]|jgi:integration host factor subunit beta|nr:HU family DNA-binding protein [Spirochaetaceae bacterium]